VFVRRWSLRSKALALLAIAAGIGSFMIVRGYAAELDALRPELGNRVGVVLAERALARGAVLAGDDLRVERIPSAFAPPGAFRAVASVAGRTLATDLAAGEAVTRTRVAGAGGPVASLVESGLRAFVVASGLPSGVLEPGDRVDVIATFGGPRPYTDTVGTGLEVLSIVEDDDATIDAGGVSGPSVVLLVSQETAEQLAYATAFGRITVAVAPMDRV
jgi:pilus assembly protein CpaB